MANKNQPIRLYYDAEFTSLTRQGELISMAFVSENSQVFYAEFNDYSQAHLNSWVSEHVLSCLVYQDSPSHMERSETSVCIKDNSKNITDEFGLWIKPFGPIEVYADCPSHDWVFFCDLFGSALNIPKSIYYIPFDLATILRCKNIDPDIGREAFVIKHLGKDVVESLKSLAQGKHNALYDAFILKNMIKIVEGYE